MPVLLTDSVILIAFMAFTVCGYNNVTNWLSLVRTEIALDGTVKLHGESLREPLVFIVHLLNKQTQSDKI